MEIKRYLKTKDKNQKSVILFTFHVNGKRFKVSSGITVNVKDWNFEKQFLKSGVENALEINESLKMKARDIESIYHTAVLEKQTFNREFLETRLFRKRSGRKTFFEEFQNWIKSATYKKTASTIEAYEYTLSILQHYAAHCEKELTFDNMDRNFYEDFTEYLYKVRGNYNCTVGNHIKNLKAFLNEMTEMGINRNLEFRKKYFKAYKDQPEIIALTIDELIQMEQLNLEGRLAEARDLFLIEAYTGLRYIDIQNLRHTDPDADFMIVPVIKTKEPVMVPVNGKCREILRRYYNSDLSLVILPKYTNRMLNGFIKDIARKLKWTEHIKMVRFRGGERFEWTRQKCDLISTHTARRSFVTNALELGIPPSVVMQMVGHKKLETMRRYTKHAENSLLESSRIFDKAFSKQLKD